MSGTSAMKENTVEQGDTEGSAILDRIVREGLYEEAEFEQIPKQARGDSQGFLWPEFSKIYR